MEDNVDFFPYRMGLRERVDGSTDKLPNETRCKIINALEDTLFNIFDLHDMTKYFLNYYLQVSYSEMPLRNIDIISFSERYLSDFTEYFKKCKWHDFFGAIECIISSAHDQIQGLNDEQELSKDTSLIIRKIKEYNDSINNFEKSCHEYLRRDNNQFDIVHGRFVKNISNEERDAALEAIGEEKHEYQQYINVALGMLTSKKYNDELQYDYEMCFSHCRTALEKILKEITGLHNAKYSVLVAETRKKIDIQKPIVSYINSYYSMCSEVGNHGESGVNGNPKIPLSYYEPKMAYFIGCELCNYLARKYGIK